jgi:hypothetical protein
MKYSRGSIALPAAFALRGETCLPGKAATLGLLHDYFAVRKEWVLISHGKNE